MPNQIQTLHTVTEYTRFYGLPAPVHPLLTLIDLGAANLLAVANAGQFSDKLVVPQLYTIFIKRNLKGLLYYGHRPYDFSEGVMGFSTPGQALTSYFAQDADGSEHPATYSSGPVQKARQLLLSTSLPINELAFQLGFEYPQYFSRLFKQKTGLSPVAFRFSAQ